MKGKMKKILGLAISAAMAVSAVMPWTGVTAFAEGESQEPALVMEQTGEPEEEPAAENETETISARNSSDIRENGHSPVVNIRYPDGTETPVENVSWDDIDKGNAELGFFDYFAEMTLSKPQDHVPDGYVYDADNSTVTVTVDVKQKWEGSFPFYDDYYVLTEDPVFTIAVKEPESSFQPVYVYVEVVTEGADDDAEVNSSGYYTYGKIQMEIPAATEADVESNLYGEYEAKIEEALTEFKSSNLNDWIQMDTVEWFRLHADNGANDYVDAGTYTWHLDGRIVATYPLTYHANGGTFEGIDGQTVEDTNKFVAGQPVTPQTDKELKLTREGYTFKGWAMSADAEEAYDKDIFMSENGLTLYAVWELADEPAPDTFTVQYKWSSATDGKALPAELNESLPVDTATYVLNSETGYYEPDLKVDETYTKGSTFNAEDGTWTFSGWSVSTSPDENGVVAIEGTWTFEADEEPPVVEPGDDNVTIDKTATGLVDDTTDVTLSIGADEETTASDVVFVLDKSASLDIRNEAMNMLDELKGRVDEGHIINVGVVNFEKGVLQKLDLTPFTEENRTTIEKSVTYSNSESSGTNIHGALAAGKAMLDADDSVSDSNKHLVLVTDGVGYLWGADPAGNNVYSIYSESIANGEENLYASPETMAWHHTGSDYYNEFLDMENWYTENGSDIENDINTYGILFEEGQYQAKNYGITSGQGRDTDWSKIRKFAEENSYVPNESLLSTASASDAAMYMVAQVWNEIASEYNAYAYADPRYSKAHPWAYTAISNLGDLGGFSSVIPETKEEYSGMFDAVKSSVLYEIEEGTVTDVIGEDFDFAGMDTLTLTVGGVALVRTSIEGTTAKFGDGYEVTYTNENGTETLVWEIKVPVEAGKGVALTYTLDLVNKSTTPGSYEVPTNEEAVLDYTSTTGAENQKEFPVPEVTYTVADTSEPSDPGPDNPPYIPDGGDEEEPSEPTEEIPEEETPQTSLPTDDTSVPDAIPGEPSAPSTEEIPDNTTPQTAQPPQTGARAAGSVVLLAGAAVVAALTLRRKK